MPLIWNFFLFCSLGHLINTLRVKSRHLLLRTFVWFGTLLHWLILIFLFCGLFLEKRNTLCFALNLWVLVISLVRSHLYFGWLPKVLLLCHIVHICLLEFSKSWNALVINYWLPFRRSIIISFLSWIYNFETHGRIFVKIQVQVREHILVLGI